MSTKKNGSDWQCQKSQTARLLFQPPTTAQLVPTVSRNEGVQNKCKISGIRIPDNVVAIPNVVESAIDADILIFVIPHQVWHLAFISANSIKWPKAAVR